MPTSQRQLGTVTIQAPILPFLTLADLTKIFGRNEKTIKEWVKKKHLPRPILMEGTKVWLNYELGVAIASLGVFGERADAE